MVRDNRRETITFSKRVNFFYMHRGVGPRADRPDVEARTQRCAPARGVSRELNRSKGGDTAISWLSAPSVRERGG